MNGFKKVNSRFKLAAIKHSMNEFKRLHQMRTVDEYVKKFSRMKARLLYYDLNLKENFFIQGFINGLREEIKHLEDVLNPKKLNDTFNFAYKFKLSFEGQQRRVRVVNRQQQPLLKYPKDKRRLIKGKEVKSQISTELVLYIGVQSGFKEKSTTFEQIWH
jgi:hypothetical protein